jgi:hypothetical protein
LVAEATPGRRGQVSSPSTHAVVVGVGWRQRGGDRGQGALGRRGRHGRHQPGLAVGTDLDRGVRHVEHRPRRPVIDLDRADVAVAVGQEHDLLGRGRATVAQPIGAGRAGAVGTGVVAVGHAVAVAIGRRQGPGRGRGRALDLRGRAGDGAGGAIAPAQLGRGVRLVEHDLAGTVVDHPPRRRGRPRRGGPPPARSWRSASAPARARGAGGAYVSDSTARRSGGPGSPASAVPTPRPRASPAGSCTRAVRYPSAATVRCPAGRSLAMASAVTTSGPTASRRGSSE